MNNKSKFSGILYRYFIASRRHPAAVAMLAVLGLAVMFTAAPIPLAAAPDSDLPQASPLFEHQPPAPDPMEQVSQSPGIAGFLDEQGYLDLSKGYTGSINPAGFQMVSDAGQPPRFVPKLENSEVSGVADPDERWAEEFGLHNGCNGPVYAMAPGAAGELYLGGHFQTCGDVSVNNVVRYDPNTDTWSPLGSGIGNGVNDTVYALAMLDGNLYAGGEFTEANIGDAIAVNRIARWDGSGWSSLGSNGGNGVDNGISSLAVLDGELYVGGWFTQANIDNPVDANRIVRWDGSEWSTLGSNGGNGVSSSVIALTVLNGELYVGGSFTEANIGDPIEANRIVRWDGNQWSKLGSGSGNGLSGRVSSLAVLDGDLYAGGSFSQANIGEPIAAGRIARWDGMQWSALGSNGGNGINNGSVSALTTVNGNLFVAGWFLEVNAGAPVAANSIARWDGGEWFALGSGSGNGIGDGDNPGDLFTLAVVAGNLYAGGWFSQANIGEAIAANRIARWDGDNWSPLGVHGGNGAAGTISTLAVLDGDLYVGGWFTSIGGIAANHIARWDGSEWSILGSGNGNGVSGSEVSALAVLDGDLYVGGDFIWANVGDFIPAYNIARWDGEQWSELGSDGGIGVNGMVLALAVLEGDLYVGGNFNQANQGNPINVNQVARWDGSEWSALGNGGGSGVNGTVWALATFGGDLYAGGFFTQANISNPVAANYIARWDGGEWSALESGSGQGVSSTVYALEEFDGELYVGGEFSHANVGNSVPANRIARWDGNQWSALGIGGGNGVNDEVRALAEFDGELYIGGSFTQANAGAPVAANGIVRWDGAEWSALGSGVDSYVYTLTGAGTGTLYAGGRFGAAGGKPSSYIGRYTTRGALSIQIEGSGTGTVASEPASIECPDKCAADFSWDRTVTLTATADTGSVFASWSGGECIGTGDCVIDFVQSTTVTAEFEALFTIGGTVSGLESSGLVLQNNSGDDLVIAENGDFTFDIYLSDSSSYEVTILQQPAGPVQTCTVENGTGIISGANVIDVMITCETVLHTVTPSAGSGGSITPNAPVQVADSSVVAFNLLADEGFEIASIGGTCGGMLDDTQFTTEPVTADCTVKAEFRPPTETVLTSDVGTAMIFEVVTYTTVVSAVNDPPADGRVTVVATTDESCTDPGPPQLDGSSAVFSCNIVFESTGSRSLTATFEQSDSHGDSQSEPVLQQVMAPDGIFSDRFAIGAD